MPKPSVTYAAKPGHAAEWRFTASKATRTKHPDAPGDQIGMELQDDEAMVLAPVSSEMAAKELVVTVKEGRVELLNFAKDWREVKKVSEDSVVWDMPRILEAWNSDD